MLTIKRIGIKEGGIMTISTELKSWTIFNSKIQKCFECSHEEFNNLILKGGLKLEGKYVTLLQDGQKVKYWIDGSINN